jgi:hypothetical protein
MAAGAVGEIVELADLFCGQFDAVGGGVLLDAGDPFGGGIGAMSSFLASSQARATRADAEVLGA